MCTTALIIHTRLRGGKKRKKLVGKKIDCLKHDARRPALLLPTSRSDLHGLGRAERAPLAFRAVRAGRPSGIPSAAIMRSQCLRQFQPSSSAKPRWVPVPPAKSHGSSSALGVEVKKWQKKILFTGSSEWFLGSFSFPALTARR
jgi:hypothetical protein